MTIKLRELEFSNSEELKSYLGNGTAPTETASPAAKAWNTRKAQQPRTFKLHRDAWTAEEDGIIKAMLGEANSRTPSGRVKKRVYNRLNKLLKHRTPFAVHRRIAVLKSRNQL